MWQRCCEIKFGECLKERRETRMQSRRSLLPKRNGCIFVIAWLVVIPPSVDSNLTYCTVSSIQKPKPMILFITEQEECRSLLLDSGLRNDSNMETFPLRHHSHGHLLPCQYIKVGACWTGPCVVKAVSLRRTCLICIAVSCVMVSLSLCLTLFRCLSVALSLSLCLAF